MSLCYDFQKWTILTLGLVLSIGLITMAYGQLNNNQTNPFVKFFQERVDAKSLRITSNDTKRDTIRGYACIQVEKNDTEKTCRYWTNGELKSRLLNALGQDNEVRHYFRDLLRKSILPYTNVTEFCEAEAYRENPEYNDLQHRVYVGTCVALREGFDEAMSKEIK